MIGLGESCLLAAFVLSGFAFVGCLVGARQRRTGLLFWADTAGAASVAAVGVVLWVLAWALVTKDFRLAYVAEYTSRSLPWHYALSALWVGQAGSLLLWAFFVGVVTLAFRWTAGRGAAFSLGKETTGLLFGYLWLLVTVLVFAADPMKPSLERLRDGAGLSPLLQHPAMLIHPPVIFLGYALWAVPFAVATAWLAFGTKAEEAEQQAELQWWSGAAWSSLGAGILLGALWSYQELGWGGYWAWDAVENSSLLPWLTGAALLHSLIAWRKDGRHHFTALALVFVTFALCNFATFLTRSGVFSSLHAFSKSPIGWFFLGVMSAVGGPGAVLLWRRRKEWSGRRSRPVSLLSRAGLLTVGVWSLLLLAAVTLVGTLMVPLSVLLFGQKVSIGTAYYNNALIPVGLVWLAALAVLPLSTWKQAPTGRRWWPVAGSLCAGAAVAALVWKTTNNPPVLELVTLTLGAGVVDSTLFEWGREFWRRAARSRQAQTSATQTAGVWSFWGSGPQNAARLAHLGLAFLAVGVAGSALNSVSRDVVLQPHQSVRLLGRTVEFVELRKQELPDKLVVEAVLNVKNNQNARSLTLRPAQYQYKRQRQWTTEVDIASSWKGDWYAILRGAWEDGRASFTLLYNPLVRWLWLGGWFLSAATLVRLWPKRRRQNRTADTTGDKNKHKHIFKQAAPSCDSRERTATNDSSRPPTQRRAA